MNEIQHVTIELAIPGDLDLFRMPEGVHHRLQQLLDRQDSGEILSTDERAEAEGLVNLGDLLSLLRLRATRIVLA